MDRLTTKVLVLTPRGFELLSLKDGQKVVIINEKAQTWCLSTKPENERVHYKIGTQCRFPLAPDDYAPIGVYNIEKHDKNITTDIRVVKERIDLMEIEEKTGKKPVIQKVYIDSVHVS